MSSGDFLLNRARMLGLAALLLPLPIAGLPARRKPVTANPLADPAAVDARATACRLRRLHPVATYGGSYDEQRFSPLKQINARTSDLGLAWYADYDTNQNQHGSPLYVDGVIYVSTAWNKVYAFDAKTGKRLWRYNPKVPGEWQCNVAAAW